MVEALVAPVDGDGLPEALPGPRLQVGARGCGLARPTDEGPRTLARRGPGMDPRRKCLRRRPRSRLSPTDQGFGRCCGPGVEVGR